MINKTLTKIFGSKHERDIKKLAPLVDEINALEPAMESLTDDQLRAQTAKFKERHEGGETLDDLLPEAFATAREAARRTLGLRPYDVQLIGGIVLHQGKISEMKTGEGKTLMSTMPTYLNALTGDGVHIVTVNDYLARRDAEWMGAIHEFLGLTVGTIQHDMPDPDRRAAYAADVTYGTNNEFGFDYLRDNMKFDYQSMVQRGHHFAIVDEVDSILVDEARTPLIISGPSEQSVDKYFQVDRIIPRLVVGEEIEEGDHKYTTGDFLVDEKAHTVALTDEGVAKVESTLGLDNLFDMENMEYLHAVNQGLRAHHLFKHDVDYMIKDGEIVIVDEFTGRMMPGRRWSDGLHQAVEAKEGVKIKRENQTLATITFQNYFRLYDKLSGMTGTADTEASEFAEIYDLDVIVIPTNEPMIRDDRGDLIYRTAPEKWTAVVEEIADCQQRGQPTLVGTISIETSETLSKRLKRAGVPHVVLNAKYHEREASIIAQAGRKGAVTIATNMAGRGTDIVLGGSPEGLAHAEADPETEPDEYRDALARYETTCALEREEVLAAGGLHILGTERHESRRIDNQLRGRSGRQGDPGSSRFYLSLEDDLMRIFARDWVKTFLGKLGMEEGEAIEHRAVTRAIERAQTQVETRNFEIRKNLLEYDDVMNQQRSAIYTLRTEILDGESGRDYILDVGHDVIAQSIDTHCPKNKDPRDWELTDLKTDLLAFFNLNLEETELDVESLGIQELDDELWRLVSTRYEEKVERIGADVMTVFERDVMLRVVDHAWKEHLLALDHLKEGIGLRGYGQKDPKQEYKRESFELFQGLKERIEDTIVKTVFRAEPMSEEQLAAERSRRAEEFRKRFKLGAPPTAASGSSRPTTVVRKGEKVGRNAPCPCGSGKKYKKCCGAKSTVASA